MQQLILAIDFDGTIVKKEDDYVAKAFISNAKEVINWAHSKKCYVIIWTCRTGKLLDQAVSFLKENGIKYDAINENYPDLSFETSRKIYADFYIDDLSFEIDWLQIKQKIANKLIEKLANELVKLKETQK